MKDKQKALYFAVSFVLSILVTRIVLYFLPNLNLDIGKYNVHHLYWAAFAVIIMCILFIFNYINKITIAFGGITSGLVVDEIIYLVATDGSDLAYLGASSVWGMVILSVVTLLIVGGIYYGKQKR